MAAFFIGYPKSRMQIACATPPLLLAYQLCKQAGLPRRVWLLSTSEAVIENPKETNIASSKKRG
jgi:hypothetical protein